MNDINKSGSIDISKANDFPVIEATNNAMLWPLGPKGNIDLNDTYEISSVPMTPNTPLASIKILQNKGSIPKE